MRVKDQNVSRCRFVYTCNPKYYNSGSDPGYEGYLCFTNSHYGWDLISENSLDVTLKEKYYISKKSFEKMSYEEKINTLHTTYLYDLMVDRKTEGPSFPFERIGLLTLYRDDNLGLKFQSPDSELFRNNVQ